MGGLRRTIEKQQRLRKRRQREGRQPQASVESNRLRASESEKLRFTENHPLILREIETSIVSCHRELEIDDSVVANAMRASIRAISASSDKSQALVDYLERARKNCGCDVDTWQTGLRVLYLSLTNVSRCRPNDLRYLEYAEKFLRRAGAKP